LAKIKVNGKEKDLKEFLIETLGESDSSNFRDVDSAIDYISNIIEFSSDLILTLYEKKVLNVDDIKKLLKRPDIIIEE